MKWRAPRSYRPVALLPPELCNQIAAGEVLERPASAVKELVENALDADARRIEVEVLDGGKSLIRVSDDGWGMQRQDAENALLRHATSKIETVADLSRIATMGFRGEALASIASVARVSVHTQPRDGAAGTRLEVEGGKITEVREVAAAPGTVIEVRDLFFNTPARLKFLKGDAAEMRRIYAILEKIALAWYDVHFRFVSQGRLRFEVVAHQNQMERVLGLLGRPLHDALYPLPELPPLDGVAVRGYFGEPSFEVKGGAGLHLFVNGRPVQDRTVGAAVQAAYRDLSRGRSPAVLLMLEVEAHKVDVNVHPTKIEVRFANTDAVFRTVYRALREGLAQTPWVTPTPLVAPTSAIAEANGSRVELPRAPMRPGLWDATPWQGKAVVPQALPLWPRAEGVRGGSDVGEDGAWRAGPSAAEAVPPSERGGEGAFFGSLRYVGQIAQTYLLTEDGQGLVIIDQHAAHERMTYERLVAADAARALEIQRLLFPVMVELDGLRAATLEEHQGVLGEMGFELSAFGGNTWVIQAVPAILVGGDYEGMLRSVLDELSSHGWSGGVADAKHALFSRMACHGSVRAGQHLALEEVQALLRDMDAVDFRGHCPHGRPVYFRLSLEEIERRFGRR